jgi:hypothetical protein
MVAARAVELDGALLVADGDEPHGHVGQDAGDLALLVVEHALRAADRTLADEDDAAAADGAVHRVLRLAVDGDGHLVADPAAAQAAAEHRAHGAGLPVDLRVGRALGAATEDDEGEQEAGEHARDDPQARS